MKSINIALLIVLAGIGAAGPCRAQSSAASDVKFLTIGDISKIDLKGKSITIKDATSYEMAQPLGRGGLAGTGRRGGGPVGGAVGGNRGGGGRRGGGGAGGAPAAGGIRPSSAPVPAEYKIVFSSRTVFKEGDNEIKVEDLKIGDPIQVMSVKSGSKIDASEIIRAPKDNS